MSIAKHMVGVLVGLSMLGPGPALGYWNEEWTARKRFQIDTSATGANVTDPIGPAAVLIRLTPGNFRFEAAKEDGSDLRIIAGDDQTPLKFHIEKYDALLGEALIWVGVPELKPGAKTDLWVYLKNPKAVAAEDAKGTYDPGMALVYHFGERGQPPRDSSTWANHALTTGKSTDGAQIGRGLHMERGSGVTIPAGPSLAWAAGAKMTWSAWIKPADGAATGVIFSRRDGPGALVIGVDAGKPFVEVQGANGQRRAVATTGLGADKWHHLAVTAGDSVQLWVDGAPAGKLEGGLPALSSSSVLGQPPAGESAVVGGASALPGFEGDLDELEISKVERPRGWMQVMAISQGSDPGKFLVAGQDEETGGPSGGYLRVIVRSVTPDGWVVIGLLGVMALVSWMVMVSKASYLGSVERANARFSEQFQKTSGDLPRLVMTEGVPQPTEGSKLHKDASLFRLFQIAAREVKHRIDAGRPINAEAIESIRASLDAGLVRENQRLAKRMVLLTIAISGGPFLGLLGTVVGVMITFAAIAAAGDVNVNAIAPGIAAALVATVAGLGVAIPALFGYNWLLTRAKDVTANMQVFVDELVTRIAEVYSAGQVHEAAPKRPVISTPVPAAPVVAAWSEPR